MIELLNLDQLNIEIASQMSKERAVRTSHMEKRFLGIEELAQYLGVAKGTVYIWCCHKKIPYLKVGRLIRFDLREIEEVWLKEKRVETMQ